MSSLDSPPVSHHEIKACEATEWEPLVARLAEDIRVLRGADPLKPITLVVSSVGMKIWLTRRIAEHLGVAANIRAAYPRQLIGEIAGAFGYPTNEYAAYSQEQLTWRIHRALRDSDVIDGTPLEGYLTNDADGVKRVRLARRLADTFDRYLAYRPELIRAWDKAEAVEPEAAGWQSRLWRAATADLAKPARHFPAFVASLTPATLARADAAKLPTAVFLIGIAGMPPAYLQVFKALGERVPVRVYQTIPSEDFLGDIPKTAEERARHQLERAKHLLEWEVADWKDHHPLLMTCGKTACTLRAQFIDNFEKQENLSTETQDADSRLARLQEALRANDGDTELGDDDGSVIVDSCHGPMREVEVLRDRLLAALDEIPGLRPRDILVLSPAIAEYTAYIHAVFGGRAHDDPLRIPYSVADKAVADGRPAYALAVGLLALPRTRMTAGEVAALLESPVTAARMRWNERDLDLIRIRLEQSGVSWGADKAHRETRSTGAGEYGTWRDFLSRLRLGFALGAGEEQLFGTTAPLPGIESSQMETLGGLAGRVDRLLAWHTAAKDPRPVSSWCALFLAEINDWLPVDDDTFADEAKTLRQTLGRLEKSAFSAGFSEPVSFITFAEFLAPELEITEDGGRFLTEGVTFAALKPLRSLPARVIALLGVNAQNFPRRNRPDGFDLMAKTPRVGDPDKTAEDRGLFLDCILATRDRLLVVVTGRSAQDDEASPLSPVVEELLAAITPKGEKAEDQVTRHPPFPYSLSYYGETAATRGVFTFNGHATAAATARVAEPEEAFALFPVSAIPPVPENYATAPLESLLPAQSETVAWSAFSGYFCDFPKFILQNRLGLNLHLNADEWPVDELPDESEAALERYGLTEQLLQSGCAKTDAAFVHATATGLVSPSGPGRVKFDEAADQAQTLLDQRDAHLGTAMQVALSFPIEFGSLTLRYEGRFWTNPEQTRFVSIHPGTAREKHRARLELDALALALRPERPVDDTEPTPDEALVLIHAGDEDAADVRRILIHEAARRRLARLVADFLRHRDTPYPLSIKARYKLCELPAEVPTEDDLTDLMRPDFGQIDPMGETLWNDAMLAEIESWDERQVRARAQYEHHVWSRDLDKLIADLANA